MWLQREVKLKPKARGFHLVTDEILGQLPELEQISVGIVHVFIRHTSASLTINENADPTVRQDFESYFSRVVPENEPYYTHTFEGPDDMPAHLKASLLGSSVSFPVSSGRPDLGTWQGVYLCEHRDQGGPRTLVVTLQGQSDSMQQESAQQESAQQSPKPAENAPGYQKISHDPRIEVFDHLITPDECQHIIDVAQSHMKRAKVSDGSEGIVSEARTNKVHWVSHTETQIVRDVAQRIADLVGIPLVNAESLQVIHYGPSQEYRAHFDAYDLETDRGKRCTARGGQRLVTVLAYLCDVEDGGETGFPRLDIEVAPAQGRVVVFQNCVQGTNKVHPESLHAGKPVKSGEKWAFNLWFRESDYQRSDLYQG